MDPKQCPHFRLCSGCTSQLGQIPPVWKEVVQACGSSLKPVLTTGSSTGWRTRAKLAVRGTAHHPVIGLYKKGTHEAVSIPQCLVHHPSINQAVRFVEHWIRQQGIQPYNEESHRGDLRYLQAVVERTTGRVQLALVTNGPALSPSLIDSLWQAGGTSFWHSIWLNENTRKTNTIFGEKWDLAAGEEYLWESIQGIKVCFQPFHFAQANLTLFEKLLSKIGEWTPGGAAIVEYYAGVGMIGLTLAAKSRSLLCIEVNPYAKSAFDLSKRQLSLADQDKLSYLTGPAEEHLSELTNSEIVIVDPPRKGLTPAFIKALSLPLLQKLIYVSCSWDSFQRDWAALVVNGWELSALEGFALFPGSCHVELLALYRPK
ncbi:MAG: hypothetical protein LW832_08915 [Parachlamydia sp.]|jgi:23S rRNA (uracil-5-)-methyltransferase RumA|nr:hypothetical protein [Parachlamydia sp.]